MANAEESSSRGRRAGGADANTRLRPVPRKGHRKSRAGCLVCKRRRVKCDEITPECGPCNRLSLTCSFPDNQPKLAERSQALSQDAEKAMVRTSPNPSPTQFNMDDLQFFQHFLFSAYPALPVKGRDVWQLVGRMSHDYDFLIHAMLGLGASHLGLLDHHRYVKEALQHRVLAIKSLNQRLAKQNLNRADRDAVFATMLSLTFQSAYMPDGMVDFFSMIRGCYIIGWEMIADTDITAFKTFERTTYIEQIQEYANQHPSDGALDRTVLQAFCASLNQLSPLCQQAAGFDFISRMLQIAENAIAASLDATVPNDCYWQHSFLYDLLGSISQEEFTSFIDSKNHVAQLISMHLLCFEFVISKKAPEGDDALPLGNPKSDSARDYPMVLSVKWIEDIHRELPVEYHAYAAFPLNFTRAMSIKFNSESKVWAPFLLHEGTTLIPAAEFDNSITYEESTASTSPVLAV